MDTNTTNTTDLLYKVALTKLRGIGPIITKAVVSHFGSAIVLFQASAKEFEQVPNVGAITAQKIEESMHDALALAQEELAFIQKEAISVYSYFDAGYPNRLKYCDDSPVTLYYKGNADLNCEKMITMVGTRKITNYGKKIIKDFLYELQGADIAVVSGLAYGVDTFVHKTCVEFNIPTIGVLAHGLDKIYPSQNHQLAKKMLKNGGLLTEFSSGTTPDRENFPKRNRIVAGLTDATIVVESDIKGGSLITADIAFSYNRDVFAFPGRVGDQYSSGCNLLIRNNKASLITNSKDLFYLLGWESDKKTVKNRQRQLFVNLNDNEQQIVKVLMAEPLSAELISVKTSQPLSLVRTHLLTLELNGVVRVSPGNLYTLN